jgi:hypothetical protein
MFDIVARADPDDGSRATLCMMVPGNRWTGKLVEKSADEWHCDACGYDGDPPSVDFHQWGDDNPRCPGCGMY